MKKSVCFIAFICLLLLGVSALAQTPSAKFAATYTSTPGLGSLVVITDATKDTVLVDSKSGYTLATIKVPQDKELLIGVSAEIGLVTDTSVKGRNGGTATATAGAEGYVTVFAVPRAGGDAIMAAPGEIMLSKRVQALSATLGGVIQSCKVSCHPAVDESGNPIIVCDNIDISADCVVTDEQIGLLQNTTAAHHFNFVLPNMNQGVYDIKAVFTTGSRAEVDICESCGGTVSGSANAAAIINKTMLTVQQVRAAKGGIIDAETFTIITPLGWK